MAIPVQISLRNIEPAEAVETRIREEAAELDSFYHHVMSCRVVVEMPHRHHRHGNLYHIRIDLTVPGGELVVNHEPSLHSAMQRGEEKRTKSWEVDGSYKHLYVAIHEAFDSARRRLQDYARRQRGAVKVHELSPHARVSRLFPDEDYGFLQTPDGVEVYFHRNSVLNGGFDRLQIGTEVSFVEEEGEKGSQASTVRLVQADTIHR